MARVPFLIPLMRPVMIRLHWEWIIYVVVVKLNSRPIVVAKNSGTDCLLKRYDNLFTATGLYQVLKNTTTG